MHSTIAARPAAFIPERYAVHSSLLTAGQARRICVHGAAAAGILARAHERFVAAAVRVTGVAHLFAREPHRAVHGALGDLRLEGRAEAVALLVGEGERLAQSRAGHRRAGAGQSYVVGAAGLAGVEARRAVAAGRERRRWLALAGGVEGVVVGGKAGWGGRGGRFARREERAGEGGGQR